MANTYQNILLAVDFHDDNDAVIEKATKMAELHSAKLHLVHVHEPIRMVSGADGIQIVEGFETVEAGFRSKSEESLNELAAKLEVAERDRHLLEGRPAAEIHEFCAANDVDLVVIGSHGKHGLQLLLGSTACSILHNASCDVLAVRIKGE